MIDGNDADQSKSLLARSVLCFIQNETLSHKSVYLEEIHVVSHGGKSHELQELLH
jgi:hypothetical protein